MNLWEPFSPTPCRDTKFSKKLLQSIDIKNKEAVERRSLRTEGKLTFPISHGNL